MEQAQKKEGRGTSDQDTQSAIRLHPILVESLVLGLGRDQSKLSVRDHCPLATLTPNPKSIRRGSLLGSWTSGPNSPEESRRALWTPARPWQRRK